MPDPRVTIVIGAKNEADKDIQQVEESLSGMGKRGETNLRGLVSTGRVLGVGFRDLRQVAGGTFLGINSALQLTGAELDKDTKKTLDTAQAFSQVAISTAFLGPLGGALTAVGLGVGFVLSQAAALKAEADKAAAPWVKLREDIVMLTELKGISRMAKEHDLNEAALAKYVQTATGAKDVTLGYAAASEQLSRKKVELAQATEKLNEVENALKRDPSASQTVINLIETRKAKVAALTTEIEGLSRAQQIMGNTSAQNAKQLDDVNQRLDFFKNTLPQASAEISRYNSALRDMADAHRKQIAAFDKQETDARKATLDSQLKNEAQHAKDIARIERDLNKSIASAREDLNKRLADLANDSVKIASDAAKEIAKVNADRIKSLADAETDRIKSIADLDRDTGKRLNADLTEHERDAIRDEAAERKRAIDEQASERRAEIEARTTERRTEIAERRAERLADLEAQKQLAREQTEAQISEMRREAEERKAERAQERDERNRDLGDALGKQLAAIAERRTQEDTDYADRKAKEIADHNDKMNNLLVFKTAAEQAAQAEKTVRDTVWKGYLADMDEAKRRQTSLLNLPAPPPGGPYSPNFFGRGYASGGDFVVPPGYGGDTYPMRVSSGERVTVTPAGQADNSRSIGSVTFNIYDASDPARVREEVRAYLESESWR